MVSDLKKSFFVPGHAVSLSVLRCFIYVKAVVNHMFMLDEIPPLSFPVKSKKKKKKG